LLISNPFDGTLPIYNLSKETFYNLRNKHWSTVNVKLETMSRVFVLFAFVEQADAHHGFRIPMISLPLL
jgi:hypothetical protein